MKTTLMAMALLMSGAAIAQTTNDDMTTMDTGVTAETDITTSTDMSADVSTTTTTDLSAQGTMDHSAHTMATTTMTTPASGQTVQPGNDNPEHDARGIAVISDPAFVPAGWNGVAATAVGGPLEAADADYPACSATVTDNCIQAYEVG